MVSVAGTIESPNPIHIIGMVLVAYIVIARVVAQKVVRCGVVEGPMTTESCTWD